MGLVGGGARSLFSWSFLYGVAFYECLLATQSGRFSFYSDPKSPSGIVVGEIFFGFYISLEIEAWN